MRTETERGVLCIDGRYIESLEDLKNIIRKGPFDIGTIKTNELLAAFRDGAVQEWLSTGSEKEVELANDFSSHSMRNDEINDTDLLSLIVKLFGDLNVRDTTPNLNVKLQLQSVIFYTPSGEKQEISDNRFICFKSGKVKFQAYIKSDRAVNGSAKITLNCPQQSLTISNDVPLNTADKNSVPVEYEFDYNTDKDYPIEFKYNDIVLFKCLLCSTIIENGYEAIDLGLSVKWAKVNIGAIHPEDPGCYFALGEQSTKEKFSSSNYNGTTSDAATSWGGRWRMPTKTEFQELIDNCKWTWKTIGNQQGYEIRGKNKKTIFLCAAGMKDGFAIIGEKECGQYWVAPTGRGENSSERLLFCNGAPNLIAPQNKIYGLTIRPVLP